ncbi:unnamed protein product [Rangifer tarandus platyrhynchus]|uniref:Uncharacterized protein n=1 Tax=Rangifer tarandus platyrhynchus TaxID=3082113 RepID=A0ABN8XJ96_RANTA|nr:unnamed protein product [Rangifer tarandus platyrhynchus]
MTCLGTGGASRCTRFLGARFERHNFSCIVSGSRTRREIQSRYRKRSTANKKRPVLCYTQQESPHRRQQRFSTVSFKILSSHVRRVLLTGRSSAKKVCEGATEERVHYYIQSGTNLICVTPEGLVLVRWPREPWTDKIDCNDELSLGMRAEPLKRTGTYREDSTGHTSVPGTASKDAFVSASEVAAHYLIMDVRRYNNLPGSPPHSALCTLLSLPSLSLQLKAQCFYGRTPLLSRPERLAGSGEKGNDGCRRAMCSPAVYDAPVYAFS